MVFLGIVSERDFEKVLILNSIFLRFFFNSNNIKKDILL